jgi:hypothetical protein
VATRKALAEHMVELIASGLIPLPGRTPQITLQFQASCVLLHTMSSKTRQPIRFLEVMPTGAAALQAEPGPQWPVWPFAQPALGRLLQSHLWQPTLIYVSAAQAL